MKAGHEKQHKNKRHLNQHRNDLFREYPLKSPGIFRSYARDDLSMESDVDIPVDFYKPVGMEFIHLADTLEIYCKKS